MSDNSRTRSFITEAVWPGLGLLGESYMLFSLGTLQPVWEILYRDCFDEEQYDGTESCHKGVLDPLPYAVVAGVIIGMIGLGCLSNRVGRRSGSLYTATLMAGGSIGLTLAAFFLANTPTALFHVYTVFLVIFGIGVGGEYPMSAASAAEKELSQQSPSLLSDTVMKNGRVEQKRGQHIQLVFSMQGVGIFLHCLLLCWFLRVFSSGDSVVRDDGNQGNNLSHENRQALLLVWRLLYSIGSAILVIVLYTRYHYLAESAAWEEAKQHEAKMIPQSATPDTFEPPTISLSRSNVSGVSHISAVSSLSAPSVAIDPEASEDEQQSLPPPSEVELPAPTWSLILRHYGVRLWGTSACWLLWDVAFYGNKLFQSSFLLALTGKQTTLSEFAGAATLNAGAALLGYFGAALIIDKVGRKNLQQTGFLVTGMLFISCGVLLDGNDDPSIGVIFMYLLSSFVGQLGPNATTFAVPAAVFPTSIRTACHGIAAASGKVGALLAALLFSNVTHATNLFVVSGYSSLLACVLTASTLPARDDLKEDDEWRRVLWKEKAKNETANEMIPTDHTLDVLGEE